MKLVIVARGKQCVSQLRSSRSLTHLLNMLERKDLAERMGFQERFLVEKKRKSRGCLFVAVDRRKVFDLQGKPHVTEIDTFFEKLRTNERGRKRIGVNIE